VAGLWARKVAGLGGRKVAGDLMVEVQVDSEMYLHIREIKIKEKYKRQKTEN
jgi:hypothetical protein